MKADEDNGDEDIEDEKVRSSKSLSGGCAGNTRRKSRAVHRWLAVLAFFGLAACTGETEPGSSKFDLAALGKAPAVSTNNPGGFTHEAIQNGLAALDTGDLQTASTAFNRFLVDRPRNATAHFLNGLTYHLMARAGDSSQYSLAEIGYQAALRFEPSAWVAAYQLGRLYFERKEFAAAQDQFAYALLYEERNVRLLLELAAASYFAQDLPSALGAIMLAEEIQPDRRAVQIAAAMIYSANNMPTEARDHLQRYQALAGNDNRSARLAGRMTDWGNFYQRREYLHLAQAETETAEENSEKTAQSENTTESTEETKEESTPSAASKMLVVEAAIIRVQHGTSTRKGVNLMENLMVILSGGFDFNSAKVFDAITRTRSSADETKTITGSVSSGSVTYSLNIANTSTDKAQLLARPALIALDGEESSFFAGSTEHVAVVSDSSTSVEEIDIGVTLTVTPTFISTESFKLAVEIERDFFEPTSLTTFGESFRTTKTTMTASVIMSFGETLILSGLTQKDRSTSASGVPGLKAIPGIQYFFNREDDLVEETTILILLTPKRASYAFREGGGNSARTSTFEPSARSSANLDRFKTRYEVQFAPAPTIAGVFDILRRVDFYREFRTGDIALGRWDNDEDLKFAIKQALGFLYY